MSLPNKITDVNFSVLNGTSEIASHTLSIYNLNHPWTTRFWEGRKQMSLNGVYRRKNIIRGFDSSLEFDWDDVRNQESEIVDFLATLVFTKENDYKIRFNVVGDSNYLYLVPEDAVFSREYTNQVTQRLRTSISFNIEHLKDDIEYANS